MVQRPILNGKVDFPVCMAPMVGLSHFFLRRVARNYLPQNAYTTWPTEMLNSRKLPYQKVGETVETFRAPDEVGLVPQILGNEESFIAESVSRLETWGAEAIDINMGCPVKKALRHNYGVSLMGDLKYASDVVAMTKRNSRIPVSVKLRSGFSHDRDYLKDFVVGLVANGASWLTLHPRLAHEGRRGDAKWSEIAFVRDQVSVAVVGNGDIQVAEDVHSMQKETGCDSVMVGRAMTARPWILWQVGEDLGFQSPSTRQSEAAPRTPLEEGREYGRMLLHLLAEFKAAPSSDLALRQFKFFVHTGSVWLEFGHSLYSKISNAKNLDEAENMVKEFFGSPQKMLSRTQLRQ